MALFFISQLKWRTPMNAKGWHSRGYLPHFRFAGNGAIPDVPWQEDREIAGCGNPRSPGSSRMPRFISMASVIA